MDHIRTAHLSFLIFALVTCTILAAGVCLAQGPVWDPRAWSRYNGWEVTAFELSGAPAEMVGELEVGLDGKGRWKLLTGLRRPPFRASALLEDLRRIRLHLARAGYPASGVQAVLTPDPAARTLTVLLEIDPGPAVRVAQVRYSGWPARVEYPAPDDSHLMVAGDIFTDLAFEEMVVYLRRWLNNAGYALADVQATLEVSSDMQVIIDVRAEAEDFYRITAIEMEGCSEDLVSLATRVLDIPVGSEFEADRLEAAAADLRGTQLFSNVELNTEPVAPGELQLRADLTNARMRAWRASVGTWNDNPWMVNAGWTHRNLFRRGRGFDVAGTFATHDQRLGAAYFWLGWLSPRARSSVGSEWMREDEKAYVSTEYRVEIVQSFRPSNRALSNLGIGLSNVDVLTLSPDEDDIPESQDWLLEFWFDRKWDWTNEIMFPTRGGYFKIGLTYAPPGGPFKSSYAKAQADVAAYRPLNERFVLAGRLRLGWSQPVGEATDLLANRRYFAGGFNTMRGYERRELGPRDSADNPRGGQAVALAGLEVRMRLAGIFDLAIFSDSGQVWERPSDMGFDDLALAVGVGLDLRSPLGPVRAGHAWNLTEMPAGRPRNLWHFGIGYPW